MMVRRLAFIVASGVFGASIRFSALRNPVNRRDVEYVQRHVPASAVLKSHRSFPRLIGMY